MAELVGGAFLSSFLQVAFQKLASHDFLNYFRSRKMDDGLLTNLQVILISVNKVMEDAEERQYKDRYVKLWLDKLKEEVFKAEDLLDDIATEALQQKLHAESQTVIIGKVRGFFTGLVNRNQFDKEIESGIQGVLNNLEHLIKQNEILGLRGGPSAGIESGVPVSVYKRLSSTRLIDESDMYGRDADKERIVEILLSQSMGGNQFPMDVIAITGMGGMGKTTLAKLVYEDVKMKDQFEQRAWVCVSEKFDVHQVTKATLQSLNCPTEQLHDLHSYQLKLQEMLMDKKFFLVLDDVWNEDCKIWEVFQAPLKLAAPQNGLIYPTQKSMSLEEAGNEMFNDLESRSFFELSRNGFIMHDLVNELAKSVTQEFLVQLEVDHAQAMSTKTRYFSCINKNYENIKIPEEVFKCHRLRTFLLLDLGVSFQGYTCVNVMSRLSRLKYIRELSLSGYKNDSENWTDGISNLKHLHYLDLSWTSVKKLSNSICLLINLQTLKLRGCRWLSKLPSNFYKLLNLRHLDLKDCGIQEMPKHMGKLNQLRTMNKFVVAKEGGSNIKELGALEHLTGLLTISNVNYIKDAEDMREANLKEKQLDTLRLNYSHEGVQHQEHILEALEPNHNVKDLTIVGYGGTKFPKWLASASQFLPNVVSLSLCACPNIVNLPPLGQLPSLQKLTLDGLDGIKVIGEELYGNGSSIAPFPCLSHLVFYNMREWEEWDICYEGESFLCLKQLHIGGCPELKKSLPQHLPCLKKLSIKQCENLEGTIPKSSCIEELSLRGCGKINMPKWLLKRGSTPSSSRYFT